MNQIKKVLLVDDDKDDIFFFNDIFSETVKDGILLTAGNGAEALQLLQKGTIPDVIFLDLNMPVLNGKDFLKEIKQLQDFYKIPVLVYTTSSSSKDIEEVMILGAACFITKSSSPKDLALILQTITSHKSNNIKQAMEILSRQVNSFVVC